MRRTLILQSLEHPKAVIAAIVFFTLALAAFIPQVKVDTDPENLLSPEAPVRVYHDAMKKELTLYDMVVVGVVNPHHPEGVFNIDSLRNVYELVSFAKTLRWPSEDDPEKEEGIVEVEILAPSTVDNISQGGLGVVKFEWLMSKPPQTEEEALRIRDHARRIPLYDGTLISDDGKALALFLPLTRKDLSYRVYTNLREKIATFATSAGQEEYHITGLPVAEDTFGVEMFIQMAISGPLTMAIVFGLLLYFFRNIVLVIAPMIVAMLSVISTMGMLIATGNTLHVMSSMIPIFIMPIAVLDSVHILSEFFDRYQETRDRRQTILNVMDDLFVPMLYTSLTTTVGFASLTLAPIPPIQVFGLFIAFGVMVAWIFTITLIPALVMLISPERLANFGTPPDQHPDQYMEGEEISHTLLGRFLVYLGGLTFRHAGAILVVSVISVGVAVYGISMVRINDNPMKWFEETHPIRAADRILNERFGGTYEAYLTLEPQDVTETVDDYVAGLRTRLGAWAEKQATYDSHASEISDQVATLIQEQILEQVPNAVSAAALLQTLQSIVVKKVEQAAEPQVETWEDVQTFLAAETQRGQTFKQPEVLRYIAGLQQAVRTTPIVGKSNSVVDIVKTVHRELFLGNSEQFRVPDSADAVAQCLITFQSSHRPNDLWHFITPDYRKTSIWLHLRRGDNTDMEQVVTFVEQYLQNHPPPVPLQHRWFGLTYINVIWQDRMVSGMTLAFLGSFVIVFLMMSFLFRSPLWGLLCMLPLTITIIILYGIIGFIGKDYDMPAAIESALSLGLAVDFAIHFLARSRELVQRHGSWERAVNPMFGAPARAISRNAIMIALGFVPLVAAPLVPYQTVGFFLSAIMAVSGIGTLVILPALVRVFQDRLFSSQEQARLLQTAK